MLRALLFLLVSANLHAYSLFPNWEGVHIKAGEVEINIFNDNCNPSQVSAVQSSVRMLVELSNRFDPEVTYSYKGFTDQRGWTDPTTWNKDPDNVVFTFDCTDGLLADFNGQAAPIDNCTAYWNNDPTRCSDGSQRYLTDAGIMIGNHVPEWRIAVTTLHEAGHGIWLLDHSINPGSTMISKQFYTEKSSQIQKVWGQDTFCAIKDKLASVNRAPKEWPPVSATIDDYANLHVPRVRWIGFWWKLLLLSDRESGWPEVHASPLQDCSTLKQ